MLAVYLGTGNGSSDASNCLRNGRNIGCPVCNIQKYLLLNGLYCSCYNIPNFEKSLRNFGATIFDDRKI